MYSPKSLENVISLTFFFTQMIGSQFNFFILHVPSPNGLGFFIFTLALPIRFSGVPFRLNGYAKTARIIVHYYFQRKLENAIILQFVTF